MNHFDVIFSNPPYNRGMDLKILNEVKKFADKIIVIMTDRVLYRYSLQKQRDELNKVIECIIPVDDSNNIFKINVYHDEAILVLNNKKKKKFINVNDKYLINNLNQFDKLGQLTKEEIQYVNNLKKIKSVKSSIYSNCTYQQLKPNYKVAYYLKGGCNNLFEKLSSIIPREYKIKNVVHYGDKIKKLTKCQYRFYLYFNDDQQVENFRYSYSRIIIRWYLSLFKSAHTISPSLLKRIPFARGKLQNEDWKRILQIPDSLYQKILKKYG